MPTFLTGFLGLFSLLALLIFFLASLDVARNLSPQGCRMSWMSPSYVLQDKFDISWTPLAHRYSLWLYREVGWDPAQISNSLPVLFVPGNAGSSHQVRSIASSATRQYYSSPNVVSPEFVSRSVRPLDFFTVEFNEDLSAFHGTTLESQIRYSLKAIDYILSLYPSNTTIIVLGHSMGGIIATTLLPSPHISSIITMSTPYTLPPARFDSRIDDIYAKVQYILGNDSTPILSLCGGATDMMIPSESCILPSISSEIFRRTVFSPGMEGAWTGVGHREMVWCHQVRWRVGRAALELDSLATASERSKVLDKWLRDGHIVPSDAGTLHDFNASNLAHAEIVSPDKNLVLKSPRGSSTHILELPRTITHSKLTVLVSQGSVNSVSPQHAISLRVAIYDCSKNSSRDYSGATCNSLEPTVLKLIPNPISGRPFPVPDEGSDESEGVVLYEANLSTLNRSQHNDFVAIDIEDGNDEGWVIAGYSADAPILSPVRSLALLFSDAVIPLPTKSRLQTSFAFPNLLSHVLLVHRVTPLGLDATECPGILFPPLLAHTSILAQETHYFPLANVDRGRTLLHTHLPAPFVFTPRTSPSGINFTIYSSGMVDCHRRLKTIKISIDWSATFGRWASRYWTTVFAWAVGVVALTIFYSWETNHAIEQITPIPISLHRYNRLMFFRLLPISFLFSFVPFPKSFYVGNDGEHELSLIAPLVLLVSSGLVVLSWWLLSFVMFVIRVGNDCISSRKQQKDDALRASRNTLLSIALLFLTIFLFVPWQVAFLGSWIFHLCTCALRASTHLKSQSNTTTATLLPRRSNNIPRSPYDETFNSNRREQAYEASEGNNFNFSMHILLLMTWLLPLVAPILAVWVRTLATAGITTPFDGDHNFLKVAPFLIFVDFASWTPSRLFRPTLFEKRISVRWFFAGIAAISFMIGSRKPYAIFNAVNVVVGVIVCLKIGRRYWDKSAGSQ